MELRQMRQDKAKLWESMQELNKRAKSEGREMHKDELDQWDKMEADMQKIERQIAAEESYNKRLKESADNTEKRKEEIEKATVDRGESFSKFLRFGENSLSSAEKRSLAEKRGTSTLVSSTDSLGGFLVPDTWGPELMESLVWYASVLEVADVQRSSKGGTFIIPANDDTGTTGAIIGQGTADTVADLTFTEIQIPDFTYTSKLIKASWEQLNDEVYDLEGYIRRITAKRIGRKFETDFTTGAGTTEPFGFVTDASAGKVAASSSAITRDEILDLIYSVDKAYRGNPRTRLAMHDSTVAAIRKLTVGSSDDRPLWQMGDITKGAPSTIEGIPYFVDNAMAELTDGVNSKVMVYGDFDYYVIRLIGGMELVRTTERFIDSRSVGYFTFQRAGAKLTNTAALKTLALAAV